MAPNNLPSTFLDELGLGDLPDERKAQLIVQMTQTLLKKITVEVLSKLSKEELDEFEKVKKSNDVEQVNQFLRGKIENYDQLLLDIIAEFKNDLKENMQNLAA